MTSVFDGMAGILNAVFGAPVTVMGNFPQVVQAIFREMPYEQESADGRTFVVVTPTVQIRKSDIASLSPGDLVVPAATPGRSFKVLKPIPSGSPASDAFVTYVLEEVL